MQRATSLTQENLNTGIMSRRRFIQFGLAAGGAVVHSSCSSSSPPNAPEATARSAHGPCAPPERPWLKPDYEMERGPIVRASFGGSFAEQEFRAVWSPFKELTGIDVVEVPHHTAIHEQIKAQQHAGRVEFDIVEGTAAIYPQYREIWMPIDYSLFPKATLDGMDKRWKQANAIGYAEVPLVIAWSKEAFPGDDKPDSWEKFWDTEKYPGGHSLEGVHAFKTIEAALLADGVPKDRLYPLDFDRAFRKLEEIKPHVAKWWTSGTESQLLLTSGEVTVIGMSNARIEDLLDQSLPFAYTLNGAIVHSDFVGVVKGAPNPRAAMAALAFRFEPAIGAAIGELWQQPIPSPVIWECADPVKRQRWANSPANAEKIVPTDPFFWAGPAPDGSGRSIETALNERFAEFVAT